MAKKTEKKEYRLTGPRFYVTIESEKKRYVKGDLVPLTKTQAVAFKDQFEPEDAAEKRAKVAKEVKAKADVDEKEAKEAKKRRAKELEERAKSNPEADAKAKAEAANPPTPNPDKQAGGAN